jgi:hypothetical protein
MPTLLAVAERSPYQELELNRSAAIGTRLSAALAEIPRNFSRQDLQAALLGPSRRQLVSARQAHQAGTVAHR